jgi:hypothetical protein
MCHGEIFALQHSNYYKCTELEFRNSAVCVWNSLCLPTSATAVSTTLSKVTRKHFYFLHSLRLTTATICRSRLRIALLLHSYGALSSFICNCNCVRFIIFRVLAANWTSYGQISVFWFVPSTRTQLPSGIDTAAEAHNKTALLAISMHKNVKSAWRFGSRHELFVMINLHYNLIMCSMNG